MSLQAEEVVTRSGGDRSLLGMALLAAGALWLVGELGLFHVAGRTLASVALVCIGAGLIMTRRTGRRRWPILIGGILALSLLGNTASANFRARFGARFGADTFAPTQPDQVHPTYETGFGSLALDLSQVSFPSTVRRTITVNVGFGSLRIVIPRGVALRVDANDSAGAVRVLGQRLGSGFGVSRSYLSSSWASADVPHLTFLLNVEGGAINVEYPLTVPPVPKAPQPPQAPKAPTGGSSANAKPSQ